MNLPSLSLQLDRLGVAVDDDTVDTLGVLLEIIVGVLEENVDPSSDGAVLGNDEGTIEEIMLGLSEGTSDGYLEGSNDFLTLGSTLYFHPNQSSAQF